MKTNLLKSKKIGVMLCAALLCSGFVSGASFTAIASGNWSSTATWGGSAPPFTLGAADEVTIGAGLTVTMDSTVTVNGLLAQVSVNGTLSSATNSLILTSGTISGDGTINANSIMLNTGGTFSFSGSVTANTFTNSVASLSSSAVIMVNNTLNLTGIISIQTAGSLTMGGGSVINIQGGSLSVNGGTLGLTSAYAVNYITASTTAGMELSGSGLTNVTVNVSSTNTVTLGSNVTVNDSLKLISGSLMLNGNDLIINGQFSGSGTFMGDENANLVINTRGGLSSAISFANGYQLLNDLTLNVGIGNSVGLGSALSVYDTLALSGGSNLNINGEKLTLDGSLTGTGSLMVNAESGLDIEASTSITTPISLTGSSIGNFILDVGSGNTVTLGSNMVVDTIDLESGTMVLNDYDLSINGNITASGNGMVFSTEASNISVTASTSMAGSLTFSYPGNSVNNFNVNIGSAGSVMLGSDLVVNGILNLMGGYVNTESSNLQIGSAGSITGANSNSYIITGTGGYLTMSATTSGTVTFPIGTVSYYSPASITLNSGSSAGTIGVNVSQGVYEQGTTGALLSATQPLVNATWSFQTSITSGLNANMQLTWSPAMEVNGFIHTGDYISQYMSGGWDDIGDTMTAMAATGGMFSIQRKGIASLSQFAVFDQSTSVSGINEIATNNGFEIYPNPVSGNLYIKNNTGGIELLYADIYNILGQLMGTYTITNTETSIPVDGLAHGQYFIKFYNDKIAVVEKFIKI
ncbi:MAG: T9SS type A sorting domain-containing protein [Bacteroidia bacterium]